MVQLFSRAFFSISLAGSRCFWSLWFFPPEFEIDFFPLPCSCSFPFSFSSSCFSKIVRKTQWKYFFHPTQLKYTVDAHAFWTPWCANESFMRLWSLKSTRILEVARRKADLNRYAMADLCGLCISWIFSQNTADREADNRDVNFWKDEAKRCNGSSSCCLLLAVSGGWKMILHDTTIYWANIETRHRLMILAMSSFSRFRLALDSRHWIFLFCLLYSCYCTVFGSPHRKTQSYAAFRNQNDSLLFFVAPLHIVNLTFLE